METLKLRITTTNNHEYFLNVTLENKNEAFKEFIGKLYETNCVEIIPSIIIFTNQIVSIEIV